MNTLKKLLLLLLITLLLIPQTSFAQMDEPIMIGTKTEDIALTDNLSVARAQVAKYPDNPEAHFNLAIALSRTSLVEEAVKELHKTKKIIKKQKRVDLIDKKIVEYEKMLEEDEKAHNIRYRLAFSHYLKAYFIEKEKRKALKKLKKKKNKQLAKEGKPPIKEKKKSKSPSIGLDIFGSDQLSIEDKDPQVKKHLDTSIKYFEEILSKTPDDIWAKIYYAFIVAEQLNDYKKANTLWREAMAQDPSNPAPHFFIGELLIKQGNLKEGIAEISQALLLRTTGN